MRPMPCPLLLLQLYNQAGVPAVAFTGVPLFQAEGLTVKSEQHRYTPLFFRWGGTEAVQFAVH